MSPDAPRPHKPTREQREAALLARVELVKRIHQGLEEGELDPADPDGWLKANEIPPDEHWHRVVANTAERLYSGVGRRH